MNSERGGQDGVNTVALRCGESVVKLTICGPWCRWRIN